MVNPQGRTTSSGGPEHGGCPTEGLVVSPEQNLLVRAMVPPGTQVRPLATKRAAVRWQRLVDMAEWHRMSPLLWRHLRGGGVASIPDGVLDQLHGAAAATTARNLSLQAELNRVLAALATLGIPVMLLKGAALIEAVYPDIGLRPMGDVDILVPGPSIEDAQGAVEALGYAVRGVRVSRDDASQLARHHHHYPLERGGVTVELHHHVTSATPNFDIAGFWERAVPGAGPVPHLLPSPEDLLLHGALHFSVDRIARLASGLGQLADLVWIAAQWPIDWDAVTTRARDYGVANQLFLALVAAQVLTGGPAPPAMAAAVRPGSYSSGLGELFVRQCVLRSRPGVPLDRLAFARGSAFPGRLGLDRYIAPGEATRPSIARLRFRRAVASGRRLRASATSPQGFVSDVRLAWWLRSLQ
jgi:Uncharacterised nucleotidyltransferase